MRFCRKDCSAPQKTRDLTLLRDCLGNVQDKNEFAPADRWNYQRLLTHVEERSQELHRHALKVIGGAYRRGRGFWKR
jgi:hypothetical protein